MTAIPYRTALIVGAGPGISASVARGSGGGRPQGRAGGPQHRKLAALATEIGAERFAVDAADPEAVARLFEEADARLGSLMSCCTTPAPVRPGRSPNSTRRRSQGDRDFGLRRLPRRAAGGAAHAPAWQGRDPADRRQRQRQGLHAAPPPSRWASSRCAAWRRAPRASWRRKGIHVAHFVIDGGVRSARRPDRATGRTARSIPTTSPRPISKSCASRAAPGHGKWSCGPGWRISEAAKLSQISVTPRSRAQGYRRAAAPGFPLPRNDDLI